MGHTTPELLVVTGPPGSGKSTVARLVADRFEPCALVEGDAFFGFVVKVYIDPWLPESHAQNTIVTQVSSAAVGGFVRGGYMTVFDGMVGPWFLPTVMAYTDLPSIQYAVLVPPEEVCVARVLGREAHGFRDEGATRQMYASFAAARIDPRHIVQDVPDAPVDVADAVLRRLERGALIVAVPDGR